MINYSLPRVFAGSEIFGLWEKKTFPPKNDPKRLEMILVWITVDLSQEFLFFTACQFHFDFGVLSCTLNWTVTCYSSRNVDSLDHFLFFLPHGWNIKLMSQYPSWKRVFIVFGSSNLPGEKICHDSHWTFMQPGCILYTMIGWSRFLNSFIDLHIEITRNSWQSKTLHFVLRVEATRIRQPATGPARERRDALKKLLSGAWLFWAFQILEWWINDEIQTSHWMYCKMYVLYTTRLLLGGFSFFRFKILKYMHH